MKNNRIVESSIGRMSASRMFVASLVSVVMLLMLVPSAEAAGKSVNSVNPSPGSTVSGGSQTYSWNSVDGATEYWAYLGSTGKGSKNIYSKSTGSQTSTDISNIPTDGRKLHFRVWYKVGSKWSYQDFANTASQPTIVSASVKKTGNDQNQAPSPAVNSTNAITSITPAPGSTLASSTETFSWNIVTGATEYWPYLGTTGAGSKNIYSQSNGVETSVTISNIPTDGKTIYVRIWYKVNNAWKFKDFTYKALVAPSPGSNGNGTAIVSCLNIPPGHFIAPGWLRQNNIPDLPACYTLPPGIAKKVIVVPPPPAGDTVAPIITGLATSNININQASVNWQTNELSNSRVYYGTTSPLNLYTASSTANSNMTLSHSIALSGLTESTNYRAIAISTDATGNTATSSELAFSTLASSGDSTPPFITGFTIDSLTSTAAVLHLTTNEPSYSILYFGLTSPLNIATANSVSSGIFTSDVQFNITGLTPSTTYYGILSVRDQAGNTATSSEQTIMTTN